MATPNQRWALVTPIKLLNLPQTKKHNESTVAVWPCFDVHKILITAFEFERVALKPVRKTTNLATMHSLESQKCMACDAWKKNELFCCLCLIVFPLLSFSFIMLYLCSLLPCYHPCFVVVCYWFCHLPGVVSLFLLMFSSFPPMGCQRKLCLGHLCRESSSTAGFWWPARCFVIVCKPCANVTPTCDRLGFQIHLSPRKKTCDMHVVMYYLR